MFVLQFASQPCPTSLSVPPAMAMQHNSTQPAQRPGDTSPTQGTSHLDIDCIGTYLGTRTAVLPPYAPNPFPYRPVP